MRRGLTRMSGCFIVIVTGVMALADEPKPDALRASDILGRMANMYAECKTYCDTGVVKTVYMEATGNRIVASPFKTAFVRPNRFRFEYTEKASVRESRFIVWQSEKDVQLWPENPSIVQKPLSLGLAVSAATGVSGGSAQTVPALLLPKDVGGLRLTDLTDAKRVEDAMIDKVDCFRVEGKLGILRTIWIDKKTFPVRQIDEPQFSRTTTYEPVIDGEIVDKSLEFDPPKKK